MRLKPPAWYVISLLLFVAAIYMWRYADKYGAAHHNPAAPSAALNKQTPALINTVATNTVAKRKSYRITNTNQKFAQLLHNNHALILRNALIDTERAVGLQIPDHLRAKGAPGSYLVQADRPLDKDFYAELSKAGATYISYVPNNAALVAASPTQATNLAANADVVAVLPYEPYYKLDSTLLPSAVEQQPQTNELSVTTFPGQRDAALAALTQLGATLIGEDRSPFGPTLIVNVSPTSLVAVAQMPLAQEIEVYTPRRAMNDLTRYLMGESSNTLIGTPTYLGLSGANVTVNLNDTGVDATHPDLGPAGRMIGDFPGSLTDGDGHGTHVAGIIAGNGSESKTVTPPIPGSATNADFRGKATNATLFVQSLDLYYGPFISDSFLQENASTNLGPTNLISNNSWGYASTSYDIHAASFDAATRDAQPNVDGEQPLLFVFSAGNNGNYEGSITSPGTAKNVITVGASDSPRYITNEVYEDTDSNDISQVFYDDTSSSNSIASFSSCGNVDIGIEGTYGRFKPDVVAPGVFTISCRATGYVDPTNSIIAEDSANLGQTVALNQTNYYVVVLPNDPAGYSASGLTIVISSNAASPVPFPNLLLLADPNPPTGLATDIVTTNNFYNVPGDEINPGDLWVIGVAAPTNQPGPVNYDLNIYVYETNYLGDYFEVLSNLNYPLKPYYLYQSGTSMSAAAVSGTLALMQEFVQSRMGITNPSPALMKAMLINGSRTLGLPYDFDVNTPGLNAQGWGLPNLPNSVPASLTNANSKPSMVLIDQSTNRALATGQYQTYSIACTDSNASISYPVRISLVWTDPPGDPAAGVALVNNLQLTVTDNSKTNVYIGNDFLSGDVFTQVSSLSNLPPGESDNEAQNVFVNNGTNVVTSAGDSINNVQNVYITPANGPIQFPLTVTISGTRINVNAVTTQTNNILQDYALVISSDDPALTSALTATPNAIATNNLPLITLASSGVPLLHQRVGANEPNLYTLGSTNGSLSQWHFFVFSNTLVTVSNTTNVAFATFLPPNLSIPRASGSADIDLYVYAPANPLPDFTSYILGAGNLDAFASSAVKSVGRTGNESVIFTNSQVQVYYIGVKSEDQQASDFGFYGIAQSNSFGTTSADGNNVTANGTSLPVTIPNAVSPTPALIFAFMFNSNPTETMIRRVTVTLGIDYGNASALTGTLQFNGLDTVLNLNYSGSGSGFTNTYDDLQEDPDANDLTSAGPGSLTQYVGQQANGLWLLAEANNSLSTPLGAVTEYTVSVDLQQPPSGFFVTIPGNSWFDDYVDVPNDATNMIIYTLYESEGTNQAGGGPIGIYLTNEIGPITMSDYGTNGIIPPGGFLSLDTNNPVTNYNNAFPGAPPLAGGYWYYGIYNDSSSPVTLYVEIVFQESLTPNLVQTYTNNDFIPLTTDGHTQSQICISNGQQLVALQVGLLINDLDMDDLSIHLTSPEGTSVLLYENRGGSNATGLGQVLISSNVTTVSGTNTTNFSTNFVYTVFTENTNLAMTPIKFAPPPYSSNDIIPNVVLLTNSFEGLVPGIYTNNNTNVVILDGWLVTNNTVAMVSTNGPALLTNNAVGIVYDPAGDQIGTNTLGSNSLGSNYLALTSGRIIQTFGVTNGFTVTNGLPYELVFYAKPLGLVDWWPGNGNPDDVIGTNNGVVSTLVVTNFYTNGLNVTTNIMTNLLVTYDTGEVDRAFTLDATNSTVCFGTNAGNFGTNDFTIDFWIKAPMSNGLAPILQKGSYCTNDTNYLGILLTNGYLCYVQSLNSDANPPFSFSSTTNVNVTDNTIYHHVAFARTGPAVALYIDGILNTNVTNSEVSSITNTNMLVLGGSNCTDGPFVGNVDELDLVDRALSPAEVFAIYHAGSLGKFNTNSLLPNFDLTIDNVSTNTIVFTNAAGGWQLFTNTFYATNGQITVEFAGNAEGVLLDDIQLVQLAATNYENYYLPEEPLTPFVGENPLGCWTLDVWDTRQDSPSPTNGELLGWNLQLTTSSTNAVLYVLTNEEPIQISTSNSITYFAVDVPYYATYATNILTDGAGDALTLYFNQNALPTGGLPGDMTLQGNVPPNSVSTNILTTLGPPPPLLPGQRYFLGVLNNGAGNANFTIEVDFNGMTNKIIPLTNASPYTNIVGTNTVGPNGPQYYSFPVPANAVMVTFQILNATNGEVDLYAHDGLPVPGPLIFDYESCNAGTNDQFIVVTTNSVPVPLPGPPTNILQTVKPSTWYLAAYNFANLTNLPYTIIATVITNDMDIIALTNAVPYTNTATPGYPTNLLYSFTVTNNPSSLQFTVTNVTALTNPAGAGNVELLANVDGYPTPQLSLYGSYNSGTNYQIIQVIPTAAMPTLDGVWYLSVPNTSNTNVVYSIEALTNFIVLAPLTWSGAVNGNWDTTTPNWVISGTDTNALFTNADAVTFDDTAQNAVGDLTTVTLTLGLYPTSMTFNNTNFIYDFNGSGSVNGPSLVMNGSGSVTFANAEGNSFTGLTMTQVASLNFNNNGANSFGNVSLGNGTMLVDNSMGDSFGNVSLDYGYLLIDNSGGDSFASIMIDDGKLQVGNNDANGSLGTTAVDTGINGDGELIFDRTDDITVANMITDNGEVIQDGTGTINLAGVNSYTGGTVINSGTIVVDNTNALGNVSGPYNYIDNGGTLDLGGLPVAYGPGSPLFDNTSFTISGAGVGGEGAIVNNGPNPQLGGLEEIILGGDATIGGTTRWDIRNGADTLNLHHDTLTKTGPNQINLFSTTVSATTNSFIIINQGLLSFEEKPNFSTNIISITVNSNGLVGENLNPTNSFTCPIVLNGGGTTNMSGSNITYLDAPIVLTNNSTIGNGGGIELFNGVISGPAGFINLGVGSNVFSATNTYFGTTWIAQGTLALTNTGSITNSTNITVALGATLDASQRIDQNLTLFSNQSLFDNGTVLATNVIATAGSSVYGTGTNADNLYINAGAFLSPGTIATIGTLSAGGTVTLGGTNYMKLNKTQAAQSNDVLIASAVHYGGTLFVTNLSGTNNFVAGDSFTLYNGANLSGMFSSIQLPMLPFGLIWSNNFGANGGTITVEAESTALNISGVSISLVGGSNIILSGSNGAPGAQYTLLTTTNVSEPLTNWIPVLTNYFDSSGDFNVTNAISNTAGQYYILESP